MKFFARVMPVLLLMAISLSSCFEIIEEIHYKKNGSGSFKFYMDLSQMKELMASMGEEESEPSDMGQDFADDVERIQDIKGLTNVKQINDEENYYFGLSFDFNNLESLNKGLSEVFKGEEEEEATDKVFYKGDKKSLQRIDANNVRDMMLNAFTEGEEMDEETKSAMAMFAEAGYTIRYTFDRTVKSASNKEAEVKGKTVTTKYFMFDEEKSQTGTIENTIKLK